MFRRAPLLAASLALTLAASSSAAQEGTLTATFDPASRTLALRWREGPAIDEVRVIVPARLAERLRAAELPDGWYLSREAGSLTLRGPAAAPPARFQLELAEGKPPREIAVEVRRDDRPVFYTDELPVGAAPRPIASLDGLLRLPPLVAPGDAILVQVLDPQRTPPAGRWTIAGADAGPFDPRVSAWDPARARRVELELAVDGTTATPAPTRAELARLAAALASDAPGQGRTRHLVRPLAAAALEPDTAIEEEEFAVEELPMDEEGAAEQDEVDEEPPGLEVELRMGAIAGGTPERGPADAYAVATADPELFGLAGEAEVFLVLRSQGGDLLADVNPGEEGVGLYEVGEGDEAPRVVAVAPGASVGDGRVTGTFLAVVPASGPGSLAFEVAAVEPLPPAPPPELLATLLTAELPPDLAPPLVVTYTDPTGEVTVEAPFDIQVGRTTSGGRPRLDEAAVDGDGDGVCVCGRFPGPLAWRGLTLDGAPVFPLAASGQAVRLPLAAAAPGPHTVAGDPAAGFPRGDEVRFEVPADTSLPRPESCSCP